MALWARGRGDGDMGWDAKADLIGQNIYYGFNNIVNFIRIPRSLQRGVSLQLDYLFVSAPMWFAGEAR